MTRPGINIDNGPSREFLVQQSTLTVLHDLYRTSTLTCGRHIVAKRLARLIEDEFEEGREFCAQVKLEFNSRVRAERRGYST